MKLKQITFILLLLLIGYSCEKEPDDPNVVNGINLTELPPATMTGENTMGCLINGEVWLALEKNILGILDYSISFSLTGNGGLNMYGVRDYDEFDETLFIFGGGVLQPGDYEYPEVSTTDIYYDSQTNCGTFGLDSTYYNHFTITRVDFDEHILSGTFELRVIKNDCDTLTITEGRFDVSGN